VLLESTTMSETTTTTPATQAQARKPYSPAEYSRVLLAAPHKPSVQAQEQAEAALPQLLGIPGVDKLPPCHVVALVLDMAGCCVEDGLSLGEYLEGLLDWGGTMPEYLEEAGWTAEQLAGLLAPEPAPLTPEQEEQRVEEARKAAAATLKAASKAYRKGEKAYRDGLLEAGKQVASYIVQRLELGDKREAATDTAKLELQQYASGKVDVNELVGVYQAYRVLAVEPGVTVDVPYGHYRDAWRQLVSRSTVDGRGVGKPGSESWALLPGIEAAALAAFATAAKDGLSKAACEETCRTLQRQHADAEKARTAEAAAKAKAEAAALEQQRKDQAAKTAAAEEENRKAQLAAKAEQDGKDAEKREQVTRQAMETQERMLAEQRAAKALSDQQEAADRAKAKADAEARAAEQTAQKAADKEAKAQDKAAGKKPQAQAKQLLPNGTQKPKDKPTEATPEQWAEMLCETLLEHPEPEDVLVAMLGKLKARGELSKPLCRALEAAVLMVNRAGRPEPKPATAAPLVPSANGTHAAAGAA
jgi:hypothetical protein